jgi:hypothetical protein
MIYTRLTNAQKVSPFPPILLQGLCPALQCKDQYEALFHVIQELTLMNVAFACHRDHKSIQYSQVNAVGLALLLHEMLAGFDNMKE